MIVVTTPTGNIGGQVLASLLQSNAPVRVIVRDPSKLAAAARDRVEVVEGSHGDAAVVRRAFAGADTVFWLVPPDNHAATVDAAYSGFSGPACEAFRDAGIKRVVGISALGRGTTMAEHAGHVTATLKLDDAIAATGVSYRALTMPGFMDNMLRQVEPIRNQGIFFWPAPGDHKAPTCATRDIAAVAARLLLDTTWSGHGSVPVLGPEDLSFNDMAGIMSDVLGKPVRFQEVPVGDFQSRLIGNGFSEAMAQAMVDMLVAKNQGMDNAEPRTPESTTPTSFRQWCQEVLKPAVLG